MSTATLTVVEQRRPPGPQWYLVPLIDGLEVVSPASGLRRRAAVAAPCHCGGPGLAASFTFTELDRGVELREVGVAYGALGRVAYRVGTRHAPCRPGDSLRIVVPV